MLLPSGTTNNSLLSSSSLYSLNAPTAEPLGSGLVASASLLNSLTGGEKVAEQIHERILLDEEIQRNITIAEKRFRLQPTANNRARFKTTLRAAYGSAEESHGYCLKQQGHYQTLLDQAQARLDQELAAATSLSTTSFSRAKNWVVDSVNYYIWGSGNAADVSKYQQEVSRYQEAANKEQRRLDALAAELERLDDLEVRKKAENQNVVDAASQLKEQLEKQPAALQLAEQLTEPEQTPVCSTVAISFDDESFFERRLLDDFNVSVVNPVPNLLLEPGVPFRYCLDGNQIFSGNATQLLTLQASPTQPVWLSYKPSTAYYTSGGGRQFVVQNGTMFVVASQGMYTINITNATHPTSLGYCSLSGSPVDMVVRDKTAFVVSSATAGSGTSSLHIVDTKDLSAPSLISSYLMTSDAYAISLQGDFAFVVGSLDDDLMIVNVSDPTSPTLVSTYSYPGDTYSIFVRDNTVFLDKTILNITNLTNPVFLTSYASSSPFYTTEVTFVRGNTLFLTSYVQGTLEMVDISNITNPTFQGGYFISDKVIPRVRDVFITENTAFVLGESVLDVVDIYDPTKPVLLTTYTLEWKGVNSLFVDGKTIFVVGGSGIQTIDLTHVCLEGTPTTSGAEQFAVTVSSIADYETLETLSSDKFDVIASPAPRRVVTTLSPVSIFPGQQLSIPLDIDLLFSDPNQQFLHASVSIDGESDQPNWLQLRNKPTPIGQYSVEGRPSVQKIAIQDNLVVFIGIFPDALQSSNVLQVLEIANSRLVFRGSYNALDNPRALFVQGKWVFVADGTAGLKRLDITDPASPALRGNYTTGDFAQDVSAEGNLVAVACDYAGLQLFNSSDPTDLILINSLSNFGRAFRLVLQNKVLYVTGGPFSSLKIIDVSNPSNATLLSGWSGSFTAINVRNNRVYLAENKRLIVLDTSDLNDPLYIAKYEFSKIIESFYIQGNTALVTHYPSTIKVMDLIDSWDAIELASYDTPAGVEGGALDLAVNGNTLFVADADAVSGVLMLSLSKWDLTLSPNASHVGNYQVRVTVTDLFGATSSDSFLARIEGSPEIVKPVSNLYAKVGGTLSAPIVQQGMIIDPNFDSVALSMVSDGQTTLQQPWVAFSSTAGIVICTPQSQHVGNYTFVLSATDNVPGTPVVSQRFWVFVDHAPVSKLQIPTRKIAFNQAINITLPASLITDPDGDPLSFYARQRGQFNLPDGLTFDAQTRTLLGHLNGTQAGTLELVAGATDPYGGQAESNFALDVGEDEPPQLIKPIFPRPAEVGVPYDIQIDGICADPEGGQVTYFIEQPDGSTWLAHDKKQGVALGTPGRGDTGTFGYYTLLMFVTATDSSGLSTKIAISIPVRGTSWFLLMVAIFGPMFTAATIYSRRAWCLNPVRKLYPGPAGELTPGVSFARKLATNPEETYSFATFVRTRTSSSRFFKPCQSRYECLAGKQLPSWLEYDQDTHSLVTINVVPENAAGKTFLIQVFSESNPKVLKEHFELTASKQLEKAHTHTPSSRGDSPVPPELDSEYQAGLEMAAIRRLDMGGV